MGGNVGGGCTPFHMASHYCAVSLQEQPGGVCPTAGLLQSRREGKEMVLLAPGRLYEGGVGSLFWSLLILKRKMSGQA